MAFFTNRSFLVIAIVACISSPALFGQTPGGIAVMPNFWVKANTSTAGKLSLTAGKASAWTDEKSTFSVTQSTAANQPVFVAASTNPFYYNFNPRLSFSQSGQNILSNSATTPDLVSTAGVMFMVTSQTNLGSTGLCYKNSGGVAYQFKPGFRIQSGKTTTLGGGTGWTIDNLASPNCPANAATVLVCNNNAGSMSVRRNGVLFSTFSNANSSTYYPQVGNGLGIGGNTGGGEWTQEEIGEVILYNSQLTAAQLDRVESYLCVKYGITKGTNGSAIASYTTTAGAIIWPVNTGYHNDIAGIGKEMTAEQLDQPKSRSVNFNEVITIANQNFTTPVSLTTDGQYVLWGNNGQTASALNTVSYTHATFQASQQVKRVWRIQQTASPSGNMVVEVDMSGVNSGSVPNNQVALLTDDDSVFGNASPGEQAYLPQAGYAAMSGKIYFSVPYNSLAAVGYFTIAVSSSPAVPIALGYFHAKHMQRCVELNWLTETETNVNSFNVERSANGFNWDLLNRVKASGNSSSEKQYKFTDNSPVEGSNFYRLKISDQDGSFYFSNINQVYIEQIKTLQLSTDPIENTLNIVNSSPDKGTQIIAYNLSGAKIFDRTFSEMQNIQISTMDWAGAIYVLKIISADETLTKKIIIQHKQN